MKQQSVVLLLLVLASSLKADYKWTGKEWVWEEDPKAEINIQHFAIVKEYANFILFCWMKSLFPFFTLLFFSFPLKP